MRYIDGLSMAKHHNVTINTEKYILILILKDEKIKKG